MDLFEKFQGLLNRTLRPLSDFLSRVLPKIHPDWMKACVLDRLTPTQREYFERNGGNSLSDLDLVALLRVFDQNWFEISEKEMLIREGRISLKGMPSIRHRWAHTNEKGQSLDDILSDVITIEKFCGLIRCDKSLSEDIRTFKNEVGRARFPSHEGSSDTAQPKKDEKRPGRPPKTTSEHHQTSYDPNHPVNLLPEIRTWQDYIEGLKKADAYWVEKTYGQFSVFNQDQSWLSVLRGAAPLFQMPSWDTLTKTQGSNLVGKERRHMNFGHLGRATTVIKTFLDQSPENLAMRERVRKIIQPVFKAKDVEFSIVAARVVAKIADLPRFGFATATRFITLARPDKCVSVNNASRDNLAKITLTSRTTLSRIVGESAPNYQRLLDWVAKRPWFNSPPPDDPKELEIWNSRAALMDVFVYVRNRV